MGESQITAPGAAHFHLTAIPGFFMQDDPSTDPIDFDFTRENFGLITRQYPSDQTLPPGEQTDWQRFAHYVRALNDAAAPGELYKVLYLGRHGEGYHNVAEKKYGTQAWDDYWSKLDGDGELYWADAHLTEIGIGQARKVNAFWSEQLVVQKVPPPVTYYSSPLDRCLATARYTFDGLDLPQHQPFRPTVKELLREVNGVHTCDRRSSRTYIHDHYPDYRIEPGFTEADELWDAEHRETSEELVARLKILLEDIFEHDHSHFISLTAHSGAITAILAACAHRSFPLQTGAVIPVLLKAERLYT